jgi:hypothetical protein
LFFFFRLAAAVLLVLLGLALGGWWNGLAVLERQGLHLWRRISPLAARLAPGGSLWGALGLGMLWGWIPCGLVYGALAWAAVAGDPYRSVLVMVGFGLGTLPVMVLTGALADRVSGFARAKLSQRMAGALVIGFALWTFLGGGGLRYLTDRPASPEPSSQAPCH